MKTRNTITKSIAITITTFALAAACLPGGQPVEAQTGDGSVKFVSYQAIGIIHGQKVRISVGNTEQSTGTLRLSFSYYLAHGSNSTSRRPVYESELISVPPGEFRFSELSHRDLNTEGEALTGRAQLMVRIAVIAPAETDPAGLLGSLEVINEVTGATTVINSNRIWEYTPCCDPT